MCILKKRLISLICLVCLCLPLFITGCKKAQSVPSYTLSAVYSNGEIDGKLRYKFINDSKTTLDHVDFNLHANAYSEKSETKPVTPANENKAYPNGVSYGRITILNVSSKGENCQFNVFGASDGFLRVETAPIFQGEEIEIDLTFKTTVPKSALRLGENDYSVNLADFFPTVCYLNSGEFLHEPYSPIGDPYYFKVHDYKIDFTVPSEYVVASCGTPTQTVVDGITTTYSYELNLARGFALALSKNYKIFSQEQNGITVNCYSFSDDGQQILNTALSCLDFFEKTFGKYPYKTLSVAETGFLFGGMEFSSLCFINAELDEHSKKVATMHEIAHQWWYGGVSNDQYNCAYIDEGLAEFSTYLYLKTISKDLADEMVSSAKQAYKSFFDLQSVLSGQCDTSMERNLSSFKSEYEYVNLVYNKSFLTFYEYERAVGETKTLKAMKNLYKNYLWREIGISEIIKTFGYGDHFNSYISGKVII